MKGVAVDVDDGVGGNGNGFVLVGDVCGVVDASSDMGEWGKDAQGLVLALGVSQEQVSAERSWKSLPLLQAS